MADEADRGNDTADFLFDVARKNVPVPSTVHGIGMCLNCASPIEGDGRWCDGDCREDFEREERRRRQRALNAAASATPA